MIRTVAIIGIVAVLVPGAVPADEETGKDPEQDRKAEQARKLATGTVITNDLLERLYGPGSSVEPVEVTEAEPLPSLPDPMAAIEFELGRRSENRIKLQRTEKRVQEAERKLNDLEARKLAIVNPYLPRPVLSQEEVAAWDQMDNAERLRVTEEAIASARKELEALRAERLRLQQGG
jgi:hypothetical protein